MPGGHRRTNSLTETLSNLVAPSKPSKGHRRGTSLTDWFQTSLTYPQDSPYGDGSDDTILFASISRGKTLLADVSLQPSEEVRSIASDLIAREPTDGWDTLSIWPSDIQGLRFQVYERIENDAPLIWSFACVYNSTHISKRQAQLFLQKIVTLSEIQRSYNKTWRNGKARSCREAFSPMLLQQMHQVTWSCNGQAEVDEDSLEPSERIINTNQTVINEIHQRNSMQNAETPCFDEGWQVDDAKSWKVKEELILASPDTRDSVPGERRTIFDVNTHPTSPTPGTGREIDLDVHLNTSFIDKFIDEKEGVHQWKAIIDRRACEVWRSASVKIQTAMRTHLAKTQYARKVRSAIQVQSLVRAYLCWNQSLLKELERAEAPANLLEEAKRQPVSRTGIQRLWSGFAARRQREEETMERKIADWLSTI